MLNTDPLEHVNSHEYLGITINSNLRWNTHTVLSLPRRPGIRRTLHPCNPEVKKVVYMSLVRPKLEYSSAAWNLHTQNNTTQLDKVQWNASRFILSDYERKSSVTDMLYKLNLDTLERRRQHHMVKTFHKVFYGHDVINIPASIIPSQRDNLKFVQSASRINCHLYSFYPRDIRFWNLLPFHLRNMKDMDAFGQSLTELCRSGEDELTIVEQITCNFGVNRANCDTSTKFGTNVHWGLLVKSARGATWKSKMAAIFSRWPPFSLYKIIW